MTANPENLRRYGVEIRTYVLAETKEEAKAKGAEILGMDPTTIWADEWPEVLSMLGGVALIFLVGFCLYLAVSGNHWTFTK